MRTWVKINEEILELEREIVRDNEWEKKWNKLVEETKKVPGCLKRTKHDKKGKQEASPEEKREEDSNINDVECLHGHLAGTEA